MYIGKYLLNLCSVFVRSDGNILVCDLGDIFVKVFFFDGIELLWFFRINSYDVFLWCVFYYQGKYFVLYCMVYCVKVFNEEGGFLYDIGQFNCFVGFVIDKFVQLFVCDFVVVNCSRV